MDNMAFSESDYGYQPTVGRSSYIRPYAYFAKNDIRNQRQNSDRSNDSSSMNPDARPQYHNSIENQRSGYLSPVPNPQPYGQYDNSKRQRIMSDKSVDSRMDDPHVYLELDHQQSTRQKQSVS